MRENVVNGTLDGLLTRTPAAIFPFGGFGVYLSL